MTDIPAATSSPSILIVDDDYTMRRALTFMLQGEGYNATEASDGESAIELVKQQTFHIAIVDLFLPGMNGIELASEITRRSDNLSVLLITAHPESDIAATARAQFGENFISKSDLSEKLLPRLQQLNHAKANKKIADSQDQLNSGN